MQDNNQIAKNRDPPSGARGNRKQSTDCLPDLLIRAKAVMNIKNNKSWIFIALALAALAGAAVWMNLRQKSDLPAGIYGGNGRLELTRLDVASLYPGRVAEVLVHEGDTVERDAVLARLSSQQSDSQLQGARAMRQRAQEAVGRAEAEIAARREQEKLARMELAHTQKLRQDNLVSDPEVQRRQAAAEAAAAALKAAQAGRAEAQAAVAQAQAQIDAAAAANDDMMIRAPKAGRIEYRLAEPGNVIPAGGKVATLLDPSDATMAIFLPTASVGALHIGDEARIVLDGIDAVWPAQVRFVADQAQFTPKHVETANEREKLMYRVKLALPKEAAERYAGLLKGGLTGNGYVRARGAVSWPANLAERLPSAGFEEGPARRQDRR